MEAIGNPSPSTPHPHVLSHTRCDFPQSVSPRIPVPANRPLTTCTPYIERRIRQILCWHSGACGLVDRRALQYLAEMYLGGEVTMRDLAKLASPEVYAAISEYINFIRTARRKLGALNGEWESEWESELPSDWQSEMDGQEG